MSVSSDLTPAPASHAVQPPPVQQTEAPASDDAYQEINARRAGVERPDLLRALRGL